MSAPNFEIIEAQTKDEVEACLQLRVEVGVIEEDESLGEALHRLPQGRTCLLLNLLESASDEVIRKPVGTVDLHPTSFSVGRYVLLQSALDAGLREKLEEAVQKWQTAKRAEATFNRKGHVRYFLRHLRHLPAAAEDHDTNRITIAYFCLSALDVLGVLYSETTPEQRQGWADWIWTLQTMNGGFRGSSAMTTAVDRCHCSSSHPEQPQCHSPYNPPHLPSTYTSLLALALLRDDFTRLNRSGLLAFVGSCQAVDGSFSPVPLGDDKSFHFQCDARISYVAVAVSSMLSDFSTIDVRLATSFLRSCQTWDGGFGARPGLEAQGGTTYCCVASLKMLPEKAAMASVSSVAECSRWLLQRQIGGFQGRPGKLEDVCYSFWCCGALEVNGLAGVVDTRRNEGFLLSAQFPVGGFAKDPDAFPDPFHSYLALAALAFSQGRDRLKLNLLDVQWNVTIETRNWLTVRLRSATE